MSVCTSTDHVMNQILLVRCVWFWVEASYFFLEYVEAVCVWVCVWVCVRHFLISGIIHNCRTHEAPRDLKFGMYAN